MTTPRYGHEPIAMRHLTADFGSHTQPEAGQFYFLYPADGGRKLCVAVPGRERAFLACLPVRTDDQQRDKRSWIWNGDKELPTLSPSLHCVGLWHGWVRGGYLIEA